MKDSGQTQSEARGEQAQESNKPVETLRDGNLKASIWRNEGENGPTFSTTFARTWRDDQGRFHDSQSYAGADMLRLGELSRTAYHRTNELRREHAYEHVQDKGRETQSRMDFRKSRSGASVDKGREHTR